MTYMLDYKGIIEELREEHGRLCESIAALERLDVNRRPSTSVTKPTVTRTKAKQRRQRRRMAPTPVMMGTAREALAL